MIFILFVCAVLIVLYMWIAHYISYHVYKRYLLKQKNWDLNICCGKTDVGNVNADIIRHGPVENFCLIDDIYNLPFKEKQFDSVLCSHTMEHVENPDLFFKELKRVGRKVTIIVPPLYDISAACNPFIHKWIFLTFRKTFVNELPRYARLPGADFLHRNFGQVKNA